MNLFDPTIREVNESTMNDPLIERKIKLLRIGTTEVEIARKLGVTPQAVNQEMLGERKSARIRAALVELTGTTEEEFFPEHFQKN